jgi:hypothetical protein
VDLATPAAEYLEDATGVQQTQYIVPHSGGIPQSEQTACLIAQLPIASGNPQVTQSELELEIYNIGKIKAIVQGFCERDHPAPESARYLRSAADSLAEAARCLGFAAGGSKDTAATMLQWAASPQSSAPKMYSTADVACSQCQSRKLAWYQ